MVLKATTRYQTAHLQCMLTSLLYAAETLTLTAADTDHLDAFDSRCLRRILGLRWYDFVSNAEVCRFGPSCGLETAEGSSSQHLAVDPEE